VREGLHKVVSSEDTIVAISTPMGRSGIGVIRLSGPEAGSIAGRFLKLRTPLAHQHASIGQWQDTNGEIVDDVVAVLFRSPHSYTGEDLLEISAHGNPLILNRIVCMAQAAGARIANPGEFTLRAVAHGKIDLLQAEAVRNFIDAQTDLQARVALQQMSGALSKKLAPFKSELVDVIAHLEAGIDFAEDDVEIPAAGPMAQRVSQVRMPLEKLQETYAFGRMLNVGIRVVIAGRPNVGKSSLFNRLVAAERAIVTEVPGTTRDVVSEAANIGGIPIMFFDTAGVRQTTDPVESIGVTRTLETLSEADLALFVVDGSTPLSEEDFRVGETVRDIPHLVVANKCDLGRVPDPNASVAVSAKTGEGLDALRNAIRDFVGGGRGESVGESVLTSARQSEAVLRAIGALQAGETALRAGTPHEMALLDLYAGLSALNELTGETTTEDILGRIFSTFCIGK
jgi:tRNA modification GTPase